MLAQIEAVNSAVNGVVWGPIMLILLVGTGIYLTLRTRGLQARRFGFILRSTIGSLFAKDKKKSGSEHNLTPFQAVSTALAGTVVPATLPASPAPSLWAAPARSFGCGYPPSSA